MTGRNLRLFGLVGFISCKLSTCAQLHYQSQLAEDNDDVASDSDDDDRIIFEEGPWRPVDQDRDLHGSNICADGKQLPDLYVLGVQKCGTSSLAAALMSAGVGNVHSAENPKEFHFFNMPIKVDYALQWEEENQQSWKKFEYPHLNWLKWEGATLEENKAEWESFMPDCPSSKSSGKAKRRVLADFTPDYHRIVPKPHDIGSLGGVWRPVDDMNVSLPSFMRKIYGEESSKVKFVMMLREPLAQMQSAWYMAKASGFIYCRSCKGEDFKTVFRQNVEGLQQSPRNLTAWAWTTMYARQLEDYLRHFSASQFYVIPMNEFAKGDSHQICNNLSSLMDYKMDCRQRDEEMTHKWAGKHPALDEEITFKERIAFNQAMAGEKQRLIKLLASKHKEGLGLANYPGTAGDEAAVLKWLEAGW